MSPELVTFTCGLANWPQSKSRRRCSGVLELFSSCAVELLQPDVSTVQSGISDKLNGDHWVIPISPAFRGVGEGGLSVFWSAVCWSLGAVVFVGMSIELQPCSLFERICFLLIFSVFTFLSVELLLLNNIERTSSAPSRTLATVLLISSSLIASGSFCLQTQSLRFSGLRGELKDSGFWPAPWEKAPVDYRAEISDLLHHVTYQQSVKEKHSTLVNGSHVIVFGRHHSNSGCIWKRRKKFSYKLRKKKTNKNVLLNM